MLLAPYNVFKRAQILNGLKCNKTAHTSGGQNSLDTRELITNPLLPKSDL